MVLDKLRRKLFGQNPAPAELRSYFASPSFRPVFFLSTGRCGTRWFTELFDAKKKLDVNHNTAPELYEQSLLAYQLFRSGKGTDATSQQLLEELVFCGRQELMRQSVETGHRYIETNNRISFFTPQLAKLFPNAQFVHLYRDPAGFVKSGMNRDWYDSGRYDFARPAPVTEPEKSEWLTYSRVAKIAWLWRETNQVIDGYLTDLSAERYRRFNFSDLNTDQVSELMEWLDIDISPNDISGQIHQKVNAQTTGDFPSYPDWSDGDREDFLKQCGDYASFLGFDYKS